MVFNHLFVIDLEFNFCSVKTTDSETLILYVLTPAVLIYKLNARTKF